VTLGKGALPRGVRGGKNKSEEKGQGKGNFLEMRPGWMLPSVVNCLKRGRILVAGGGGSMVSWERGRG